MSEVQKYDYIVVGGGSAGCVVAGRLAAESEASVLLLESGYPADIHPETLSADGFKDAFANDGVMWDRMSQPQSHCDGRALYVGTGTGIGGSGAVNGMVYTRGDRADYDQWPEGWHWQDVLPAFNKLEARLRVRSRPGTQFTSVAIKAAERAGFVHKDGLNDGELSGFIGYNDMNYEGCFRRSSYVAFIRDAKPKNLAVQCNAKVRRILFEDRRAIGLEYVRNGERFTAYSNHEVILCAGALETPKLLMLSGIGPSDTLEQHSIPVVKVMQGIGENLHDHPNVCLFYRSKNVIDFNYPQLYGFHRMNPALNLPSTQPDTCFVFFSAPSSLMQSMKRMLPLMMLPQRMYQWRMLRTVIRKLIDWAFTLPPLQHYVSMVFGIVVILGKPESKGRLTLGSADPDQPACIDPAYYRNPKDMDTLLAGIDMANAIAGQPELVQWGSKAMVAGNKSKNRERIRKWVKKATMTTFHFCGTCAMGLDSDTPVDTALRLKGVKGLRIADASVIPEVPVSAINAPSMMIGWRAADLILGSYAALQSAADAQVGLGQYEQQKQNNTELC